MHGGRVSIARMRRDEPAGGTVGFVWCRANQYHGGAYGSHHPPHDEALQQNQLHQLPVKRRRSACMISEPLLAIVTRCRRKSSYIAAQSGMAAIRSTISPDTSAVLLKSMEAKSALLQCAGRRSVMQLSSVSLIHEDGAELSSLSSAFSCPACRCRSTSQTTSVQRVTP